MRTGERTDIGLARLGRGEVKVGDGAERERVFRKYLVCFVITAGLVYLYWGLYILEPGSG